MARNTDTTDNDTSTMLHRSGTVMRRLIFGQVVSSDFFARNWLEIGRAHV